MPRLAVIQTVCRVGDVEHNLSNMSALVAEAGRQGADLVCLPELSTTGFVPERFAELAEPIPGPSTARLGQAAKAGRLFLVAGLLERDPQTQRLHNACVLISPGGELLDRYRKVFLYLGERDILWPGSEPCLYYVFPEYLRWLVDQGAQLLVHPTAWLTTDTCRQWHYSPLAYRAMGITRALENTVFFLSANHCGDYDPQGSLRAIGQSAVIAPWGEVLAEVSEGQGVAVADVDFGKIPAWQQAAAPYLADRGVFAWKSR